MILQSFDLAGRTGIATGQPGAIPKIYAAQLKLKKTEEGPEVAWRFGRFLDEFWTFNRPDLIVVEDFMHPAASENGAATIYALLLRGALEGAAGRVGVPVRAINMSSARLHFCGRSSAHPRRQGAPRTNAQKKQDREDTNMMVWRRAVALGYFGRGDVPDFDKGSAACLFSYASDNFYGKAAQTFQLFEGGYDR